MPTPPVPTQDGTPSQDEARVRRLARALTLLAGAGSVLIAPPILGPLIVPDGEFNVGVNWFFLWCSTSVGAVITVLATFTWWRGGGWLLALRRRWRLASALVLTFVLAAGGSVARVYHRHNHPDWREVVDLGHPDLAAVAAARAAGDDDRAERELIAALQRRAIGPGPWSMWTDLDRDERVAAGRALLQDRLVVSGSEPTPWPRGTPLPWAAIGARARFQVERGDPMIAAFVALDDHNRAALRERAESYFLGWASLRWQHRIWPWPYFEYVGDDPLPNRTMAALQWYAELVPSGSAEQVLGYLDLLLSHRAALLDPTLRNTTTNHALMQIAALSALSAALPWLDPGGAMAAQAMERHRDYVRYGVTDGGVARELTPGYHCTIAYMLLWHLWRRHASGFDLEPADLERVRQMVVFMQEIRLPDGTMPLIADTVPNFRCDELAGWRRDWPPWPRLHALAASPKRGALVRSWPGAGYTLLRSAPDDAEPPPIVATLMAGPGSFAHVHDDKLGITLFGAGRPLLAGPGYLSFFDPERPAALRTTAQSAPSLDGASHGHGGAELIELGHDGDEMMVRSATMAAQHRLYPGATLRRRLAYGPERQSLLLVDELETDATPSGGERVLQVHERLLDAPAVEVRDGVLRASWPAPRPATLHIRRWSCPDSGEAMPLSLTWRPPMVWSELSARRARIVTLLAVGGAPSQVSCRDGVVTWVGPAGRSVVAPGPKIPAEFVAADAPAPATATGSPGPAAPR